MTRTLAACPPDPSKTHLNDLIIRVKSDPRVTLGLAIDGDADRYGIVDADGSFIEPNYILALLYDYLLRRRGEKRGCRALGGDLALYRRGGRTPWLQGARNSGRFQVHRRIHPR